MILGYLKETTILYAPDFQRYDGDNFSILIDPEGPNWIGTNPSGAEIIGLFDGRTPLGEVARGYSSKYGLEWPKAWLYVHSFTRDTLRYRFLSTQPFQRDSYPGRGAFLSLNGLKELWFHTNNSCNLGCTHCLVGSSPSGEEGMPTNELTELIRRAKALGVSQFYFTGGEPFLRPDLFQLCSFAIAGGSNVTILTNGTLINKETVKWLNALPPGSVRLQISLDGSKPEVNDPIRGRGSFESILRGIGKAVHVGLSPTVATVLLPENLHDLPELPRLLHNLGVTTHHLLYPHRRGRALQVLGQPSVVELTEAIFRARAMASELDLSIDNFSVLAARLHAPRFTQFDLSTACWDSLCVYSNGEVYPSAVFAGHKALCCGNIRESSLEEIWRSSPTCQLVRSTTLQDKSHCRACTIKFLCGGGDIEYAYFASQANLLGLDPYCELYKEIIFCLLKEWVQEAQRNLNSGSNLDAPRVYLGMGEGGFCCPEEATQADGPRVRTIRTNCTAGLDRGLKRQGLQQFYAQAAKQPQQELCCPSAYPSEETQHIPQEAIKRFYGCGGPLTLAGLSPGETVLDLGSGAGMDCFLAAKKVGPNGRVFGLDMTDTMLQISMEYKGKVSDNLGYDVVRFIKGFLEEIPFRPSSVDLVISNCVTNLSADKRKVFSEMWRVLKDQGRFVISDIVSGTEVPTRFRSDKLLWGQCLAGALTEEEFFRYLEQAGFHGIEILHRRYWKTLEGCSFFSITLRGYKLQGAEQCSYDGHAAMYRGPFKAVMDEEGHLFPRGEAVEVCTDTAERLQRPPYSRAFVICRTEQPEGPPANCHSQEKCC